MKGSNYLMSEFMSSHWKKIVGMVFLIVLTVAMGIACAFTMTKNIEVSLDENTGNGSVQTKTLASQRQSQIGEVLKQKGYPVDNGEYTVSVPLDTKVKDVDNVTIKKNAKGTLNVDGNGHTYDSTADTVGDLLKDQNITLGASDVVVPSADTPLTTEVKEIKIVRREEKEESRMEAIPFEVKQTVNPELEDGKQNIITAGVNGSKKITDKLIYEDGILVSRETVSAQTVLEPVTEVIEVGSKVTTEVKQETREESIAFSSQKVENPELEQGKTNVKTAGVNGTARITENVTYENGKETTRSVVSKETIKEPVTEVVEVGTKAAEPAPTPTPEPTPEATQPEAPAEQPAPAPEPAPAPTPEPAPAPEPEPEQPAEESNGIDLSNATHFTANCTAYVATGNATASGAWPTSGHTIAADLSNYPIGTRIYIPYFDTVFTVEDSGGAVKGNVIDIFFDSYAEAISFGRRNLDAYVLN